MVDHMVARMVAEHVTNFTIETLDHAVILSNILLQILGGDRACKNKKLFFPL